MILDFFAGSGTTGHAVCQLSEDQVRKFILVQLPEPSANGKVISEITIDRLKKSPLIDKLGFKVFKLDQSNFNQWESDFDNLEQSLLSANKSVKADRTAEDVLHEILLKYGIELTVPVEQQTVNGKQVYVVGAGALLVCLDDDITTEVVEGIAALKHELDPESTQVVFKDAGFADSVVKTNAIQILKQAGIDDVKSI